MTQISALFFDVGGVLLSNGWDHTLRQRATEHFQLDWNEFRERHDLVAYDFEIGRISLDRYLECTVFYKERAFTPAAFKEFMFTASDDTAGGLEIVKRLAQTGKYLLATLNNESLELNLHRIEKFNLRDCFSVFISSCYVGLRKPELGIYRLALNLSQRKPAECVFVDDRALNVERAAELGLHAIQYRSPAQLTAELVKLGVRGDSKTTSAD
jgi:putative hydrolase of the HAD superfamily